MAVDLAPGPAGKWGQIIIFGRDYDCKYVVARSWGAFLATFADDISRGDSVHIDEETGDMKLLLFKKQGVEPGYMDILRWRCDQKFGRRPPPRKRHSAGALRINSNINQGGIPDHLPSSPYSPTPTSAGSERGLSPHRSNGKAPLLSSPLRPHISSPLARVAEESSAPAPLSVRTDSDTLKRGAALKGQDKLISMDSPAVGQEMSSARVASSTSSAKENQDPSIASKGKGPVSPPQSSTAASFSRKPGGSGVSGTEEAAAAASSKGGDDGEMQSVAI